MDRPFDPQVDNCFDKFCTLPHAIIDQGEFVWRTHEKVMGFDYDWNLWTERDNALLKSVGEQKAAGNIDELCPSENVWHFRAVNEFGEEFIKAIDCEAVTKF